MIEEKDIRNEGIKGIPFAVPGKNIPNRGSWRVFGPVYDYKECIKCGMCEVHCPDAAIRYNNKGFPETDPEMCKGCGVCADVCPVKCIRMERVKK